MGLIIERARELREKVLSARAEDALAMSTLWEANHQGMHRKAIASIDDEGELIRYLSENNTFTYPRLVADKDHNLVVGKFLAYLENQGTPLAGLPQEVAESPLIGERTLFSQEGRNLSSMFLLHLCVALRIKTHTKDLKAVVEIGAGYGNLVRIMHLLHLQKTYFVVDLLDSIYCSYVFISVHFPDARILFVTDESELRTVDDYHFVFVPTEFFNGLRGKQIDLVINTCSLGEMPQATVDAYMDFVNNQADVCYFYSLNRYGLFDADNVMPDQADVSVKLDRMWHLLVWDAFGERGFGQIETGPLYLEILAEKLGGSEITEHLFRRVSALLFAIAGNMPWKGSAWHFCMWDAIRVHPSRDLIRQFLKVIEPAGFRDASYYRSLFVDAVPTGLPPPDGVFLDSRDTRRTNELDRSLELRIQQITRDLQHRTVPQPCEVAPLDEPALPEQLTGPFPPEQELERPASSEPQTGPSPIEQELERLRAELRAVYSSGSWRLTRPLRSIRALITGKSSNR